MKRLLFVVPPDLGNIAANHEATSGMGALTPERNVFAYPPHTIALCAATAAAGGWSVEVADGTGEQAGAFAAQVARMPADALAVLVTAGTAEADLSFLRLLGHTFGARGRPPVLLFGPSAGVAAASWPAAGLSDAVLAGEPELSIGAALEQVAAGERGLLASYELVREAYSSTNLISDLDAVPFAAWDKVPWQPFQMVSLLSSRGCGAGCHFCAYTLTQGNRFRAQSVERTVAEWAYIAQSVAPPYLIVRDPVFAHDRGRVASICARIASQGFKLGWACESRPEHFDRALIRLMKGAGCATIKIGMESGDPALLARIGRVDGRDQAAAYLEQVGKVAAWCKEAEVRCRVFVMAGLPGQDAASVDMTLASLRRVAPWASVHPNVYRPYEGVTLEGVNQPVAPQMLEALRGANRQAASPLGLANQARRVFSRVKQTVRPGAAHGNAAPRGATPAPLGPSAGAPRETPLRPEQYPLAGSRVFLTGGSGFIGGHVARDLLAAGAEVRALVRRDAPLGSLAGLPIDIVRGDLTQPAPWTSALGGCRFCFHLAALYGGPEAAAAMFAVNARATTALLAACAEAGVSRFIHTSTVGTVGRPTAAGVLPDESLPFELWEQSSHYVRSKLIGELIARSWNGAGLEVVIVKPAAPVGAGDGSPERRPTATGRRILAALQGRSSAYPAGGANHAPVQDIAAGHLLAAVRGAAGETYILGHCGGNLEESEFLRMVALAATENGLRLPEQAKAGAKPGIALSLTVDPGRAVRELGLPQSDLRAAFVESVAWYKAVFAEELTQRSVTGAFAA